MNPWIRILYLEDEPNDVELVRAKLQDGGFICDVTHVETQADFVEALDKGSFDVILADYKLPSFDGLSALAIAQEKTPNIPFIFISGVMGEELAIDTLKSGATDYVLKQRLSRLVPAIHRALDEAKEHLERKRAEEALEKLSRQNELILNSASEGIVGLDLNGNHIFVNPAAAQMLGYRVKELLGKHAHEIWHHSRADGSPYPEAECPICSVCKHGIIRHVKDEVFWRKNNTRFPVAYTSTPIIEDGKLLGAVVTFTNITRRKREEEELRNHRKHLKELVEKRTTELKKVSEYLERSNTELRQFAFEIAHDLLNPLNVIAGSIYLFEQRYKGKLDSQFDDLVGYSSKEFNRIKIFVEDLLAYTKIEMTSQDFDSVNLSSVVDEAVNNLQQDIKESGVAVTYDELPIVFADKIQMIRLFQNLIGNAIKYRGKKAPSIDISAERKENEWVFSIRDNGIGIEAKNLESIFTIFQRVDNTARQPGAGIGLAVCKKIVEHHGGKIWVESEPCIGSTFSFSIPVQRSRT